MKKRWIQLVLILGLMALTCLAAQATESQPTSGLRNLTVESKYRSIIQTIALDASGNDVTVVDATDGTSDILCPGAAQVRLTYQNPQSNKEYLLIVLSDDEETPSVDNMAYIDQKNQTAAGPNGLEFTIYPKKPDATAKSVTYSVYMSSDGDAAEGVTSYEKVASFEYYSTGLDVTLGDVDDDGDIMVADAVLVLRAVVEDIVLDERQTAAADVDRDGDIMVADAVYILRYVVEDITSFDNLNA